MNFEGLKKIVDTAGLSILGSIGVGAALFGLFFLVRSDSQGQPVNITAVVTIFAGLACLFVALTLGKNKSP